MNAQAQLAQLQELSPEAELWTEDGQPVAFLPAVRFAAGGSRIVRDLLLWPRERDGYATRLFVSEPVNAGKGQNWKAFSLFGRTWHACSWQGVPGTLPWIEILANHLRAFR